ncbi:MAG: hypothetical protein V4555_00210 [Acidobacteriota bacterium]
MNIPGIGSIDLTSLTTQTNWKSLQKVGQDLKSGDLSGAQTDFVSLLKDLPTTGTIGKASTQLGQDLQSGNLTAAQQDYATLSQNLQAQSMNSSASHHPRHGGVSNDVSQLLNTNSPVLRAYLGASSTTSDTPSTLSVTA